MSAKKALIPNFMLAVSEALLSIFFPSCDPSGAKLFAPSIATACGEEPTAHPICYSSHLKTQERREEETEEAERDELERLLDNLRRSIVTLSSHWFFFFPPNSYHSFSSLQLEGLHR
ncbi:hypothetical protein KFK09_000250 [Dendrobium nobile]|uniref:Uncharacterized protein n=1 Tax=Dendrobium nobile TaxID=94219 RepID=A0A8T3CBC3_DENNO|nr:hypothetical protein KFK09_000250 [Dendrobium nobile]